MKCWDIGRSFRVSVAPLGYHAPSMRRRPRPHVGAIFGGVVVLVVGLALRTPIISVSPILSAIQDSYRLGSVAAGLLTSLPVLCFAAGALLAPWLARRFGMERIISLMLGAIIAGMLLRALWGSVGLFLGTVVLSLGIAVNNVLLPAAIKRHWQRAVGPLMSALSVSLALGPTLAALFTVPSYQLLGASVRSALLLWALLPTAGLILFEAMRRQLPTGFGTVGKAPTTGSRPWREPLAWQVSAYLGLQSLMFFSVTAWLPTILSDQGLDPVEAGIGFAAFTSLNIVGSLAYPLIAVRLRQQRGLAVAPATLWLAGTAGLLLAPASTAYLWAGIAGLGSGAGFSLALTLLVLRTHNAADASRLSGMAQSVGYALAATGPLLMGWLFEASGGWAHPLLLLLTIAPLMAVAGLAAGRPLRIGTNE